MEEQTNQQCWLSHEFTYNCQGKEGDTLLLSCASNVMRFKNNLSGITTQY